MAVGTLCWLMFLKRFSPKLGRDKRCFERLLNGFVLYQFFPDLRFGPFFVPITIRALVV